MACSMVNLQSRMIGEPFYYWIHECVHAGRCTCTSHTHMCTFILLVSNGIVCSYAELQVIG